MYVRQSRGSLFVHDPHKKEKKATVVRRRQICKYTSKCSRVSSEVDGYGCTESTKHYDLTIFKMRVDFDARVGNSESINEIIL